LADPATRAVGFERETDEMASLITQVESELDTALRSLNGWAENVLSGEQQRIAELRNAWRQQASRIRELDRLLNQTALETPAPAQQLTGAAQPVITSAADALSHPPTTEPDAPAATVDADSIVPSIISEREKSRSRNVVKLRQLRNQMYDDLMATLAWVRELVTMIHLAKFTGAPASDALELVRQIAAAVEGLSKVNRPTPHASI
jgi:hypothetical protein